VFEEFKETEANKQRKKTKGVERQTRYCVKIRDLCSSQQLTRLSLRDCETETLSLSL